MWLYNLSQIGGGIIGRTQEKRGMICKFCTRAIIASALDPYCVVVLQDCLLCPTGFSANMAVMMALGSISSLLAVGRKPAEDERIAIFSDALNHASIIDGIRLLERQQEALVFVYKHCDMFHLDFLLYVPSSQNSNTMQNIDAT
jgi:7-keto-8-aminopelargonate synthetase-like enzyme